ncbi:hypothetical protein SKAU_G00394450 [Synaphobranchus kaupii]|uniref:Uncharacterized protein n=1 Tax=Synaphobranchus kaupii TaxID=118154 RepID=A0A9Q1EC74_SYNKA|nr:hypothetical protein SKAU_G00394450 [Synaphobranchus kaupii]
MDEIQGLGVSRTQRLWASCYEVHSFDLDARLFSRVTKDMSSKDSGVPSQINFGAIVMSLPVGRLVIRWLRGSRDLKLIVSPAGSCSLTTSCYPKRLINPAIMKFGTASNGQRR